MTANLSSILFDLLHGENGSISETYTASTLAFSQSPGVVLLPTDLPGFVTALAGGGFTADNISWANFSTIQQQQQHLLPSHLSTLATVAANIMKANITTNITLSLEQCSLLNVTYFPDGTSSSHPGVVCLEHAPTFSKSSVIRVFVLTAMAIVSLLGNISTMWSIQKNRRLRRLARHNWSAIYSLIFHLSIADLLVTCFCIIGEAGWSYTVEWVAGTVACKLFKMLQMFSLYLSTYVLVLVGVDRWVAVKYPMKSFNTARRCHRFLLGAYSLSFLLSIPQVGARC